MTCLADEVRGSDGDREKGPADGWPSALFHSARRGYAEGSGGVGARRRPLLGSGGGHGGEGRDPMTDGRRQQMRAGDADRDRVTGILGVAYTEGRLSKDEYD